MGKGENKKKRETKFRNALILQSEEEEVEIGERRRLFKLHL